MGKALNGPYGHLQGKVGGLVHYMLKGQPVVRIVGVPPQKRSLKQQANQKAMSAIMDLLRPALRFINVGFESKARDTVWNPHNLAVSYNKKHALTGEFPNLRVDYSKVQFSQGDVPLPKNLEFKPEGNGIRISWDAKPQDKGCYADDIVMVMALYPEKGKSNYMLNAGQRSAGSCFLALDESLKGSQVEIYIVFRSAYGSGVSNTAYVGNLNGVVEDKGIHLEKKKHKKMEARLKVVSAAYFKQIQDNNGVRPENKAFNLLEKEYEQLKQWLRVDSGG